MDESCNSSLLISHWTWDSKVLWQHDFPSGKQSQSDTIPSDLANLSVTDMMPYAHALISLIFWLKVVFRDWCREEWLIEVIFIRHHFGCFNKDLGIWNTYLVFLLIYSLAYSKHLLGTRNMPVNYIYLAMVCCTVIMFLARCVRWISSLSILRLYRKSLHDAFCQFLVMGERFIKSIILEIAMVWMHPLKFLI